MKADFVIRKARIQDAEAVVKLTGELFRELGHVPPLGEKLSVLLCRDLLERNSYTALVAESPDRQIRGVLTLSEGVSIYAGGKFGIIREFYVVPEMRSKGIGKALLEDAKKFMQERNWMRIEVTEAPKEKYPRTHQFYIREGFHEVGPRLKFEAV